MKIKLSRVIFHVGVQIRASVKTSIDATKDGVELFLTDTGVYIQIPKQELPKGASFKDKFIPFTNVIDCDVIPMEEEV